MNNPKSAQGQIKCPKHPRYRGVSRPKADCRECLTLYKRLVALGPLILAAVALFGCDTEKSSDTTQQEQQERILAEGTAQTGMPAIKNFRERKMYKEILELRDQSGFATYTYLFNEMTGQLVFLGHSVGFGIPYATQYTNPQKVAWAGGNGGHWTTLPQADPNGLFSPASADGTWVLMKNPTTSEVKPVYIEPKIIVSPFPLNEIPIHADGVRGPAAVAVKGATSDPAR